MSKFVYWTTDVSIVNVCVGAVYLSGVTNIQYIMIIPPSPAHHSPGLADTQMEGFMSGYFNILLFRYW